MDYLMGCDTLQRNDDTEDIDPQYNFLLKSLKQEGNSWIVEANEMNALPESYIVQVGFDDGLDQDIGRQRRKVIGGNTEDVLSDFSGPENGRKKMIEMSINPNSFEDVQCFDEEPSTQCDMKDGCTKRCKDPDYALYLTYYANVYYDVDNQLHSQMDTCRASMERNPEFSARIERSEVNEDDSSYSLGSPSEKRNSLFRDQLIRVLRKPFDKEELEMLAADMKSSKPVVRHMDLRGGREMPYATNKDGKSYLQYYPGLKRKLKAALCGREELNLLRGFFFWLQNLTQEGAFIPWEDKECLAMRPGDA